MIKVDFSKIKNPNDLWRMSLLEDFNLRAYTTEKDSIIPVNAEEIPIFRLRWNQDDDLDMTPLLYLNTLQPMLDETLKRALNCNKSHLERRGKLFCELLEMMLREGGKKADEVSKLIKDHFNLFRPYVWKRRGLHQWLIDQKLVTAATYQKILDSVSPEERDIITAWGQAHNMAERLEKIREKNMNRTELSPGEWRLRWSLEQIRDYNSKTIRGYKLKNWHWRDNEVVIIPDHIGNVPVLECDLGKHFECQTLVLMGEIRLTFGEVKLVNFDNRSKTYYKLDRLSAGLTETAEIPEDKIIIADDAFTDDRDLKHIKGLDHVKKIGFRAFCGSNLEGFIEIPASVRHVNAAAFMHTNIEAFRVPDTLLSCGHRAFMSNKTAKIFCSPETAMVIGGMERKSEYEDDLND